jgi:hypothetical protein
MRYAVWDDGSMIHARNLDNVREIKVSVPPIPADAMLVDAADGKEAVKKSGLSVGAVKPARAPARVAGLYPEKRGQRDREEVQEGCTLTEAEHEAATEAFFEASSLVRMVIDECRTAGNDAGAAIDQQFQDIASCLEPVRERLKIIGRILDK